jgi:hypothetical protein
MSSLRKQRREHSRRVDLEELRKQDKAILQLLIGRVATIIQRQIGVTANM